MQRPLIIDRPDQQLFGVSREAFRDPELFAAEMKRIFERGWVFVGHASQVPNPNDYLTTVIGTQPVVLARDAGGALRCFLNSCRHKGARIALAERGNVTRHVCRYHGWSFDSAGRNVAVRLRAAAGYPEVFDRWSHDLVPAAQLESYRGFVFASLADPGITLAEHLGDARTFIDLIVDQSPEGIELVPGRAQYTYRGNWKLQLENSLDAYHFLATHPSYLQLLERRARMQARDDVPAAVWQADGGRVVEDRMGAYGFRHGHAVVWTNSPIERHPLFPDLDALEARVGRVRAGWMLRTRQFNIFPNLQLASNAAIQMRVIRPLSVDLTELNTWCIAPGGEPRERRRQRIRQYEDFFNPSGLATPDDTVNYEDVQRGLKALDDDVLQGYLRGARAVRSGADDEAAALGISPETSMLGTFDTSDETVFHAMYRAWSRRMADPAALQEGPSC